MNLFTQRTFHFIPHTHLKLPTSSIPQLHPSYPLPEKQLTPFQAALNLADDFVDNVITAACRLAKIRPNATLDIRDIQLVLERNYNIRVPGYSLDEIRTVRKFQPAQGWTQKMNAVQAAKVMGRQDG